MDLAQLAAQQFLMRGSRTLITMPKAAYWERPAYPVGQEEATKNAKKVMVSGFGVWLLWGGPPGPRPRPSPPFYFYFLRVNELFALLFCPGHGVFGPANMYGTRSQLALKYVPVK